MQVLDRVGERLDRMAAEREMENAVAKERQAAIDKRLQATEKQVQATEKQVQVTEKQLQATEKQLQATEKQVQITSAEVQTTGEYVRELGRQIGDVGNQWGKIAEYLVAGDFAYILKERFGIKIDHSAERLSGSYQGREWEVDAFGANGEIALVGEVKLTLTMEAVDRFVNNNLRNFHRYMPMYRDRKIHGLLAFVRIDRGKEREITEYVHNLGLLLVKAIDNTFRLISPEGHKLRDYSAPKS